MYMGNLLLNAEKAVSAWGLAPLALSATKLSLLKSNEIAWKNKKGVTLGIGTIF